MRQGCISLGRIQCDNCKRIIPHSERYLAVDEEDGVEVESGKKSYYCVECCQEKGYAEYREEKKEQVLTFFPGEGSSEGESSPPESGDSTDPTEDRKDNE